MAKKNKQQKHSRKKIHHTHDSSLPHIEVSPTFHHNNLEQLPAIVIETEKPVPRSAKKQVQRRLNFVDHKDLRHLSCVRIVSTITTRYKASLMTTTSGCYCPAFKGEKAEIRLSYNLIIRRGIRQRFRNWLFWYDPIVNTLFHEIGHHKAAHTRFVSHYKDEAYAEKYMQAYRAAWFKRYGAPKILYRASRRIASMSRAVRGAMRRVFHRHDDMEHPFLTAIMLRLFRKSKTNQQHPLQRKGYRKKFDLDNR